MAHCFCRTLPFLPTIPFYYATALQRKFPSELTDTFLFLQYNFIHPRHALLSEFTNTSESGTTTKAVVSIALKSGKVVATEKAIAFPTIPHLATFVAEFTPEVALPTPAYNEQSILVFGGGGLMQNPTELGLTPDRISFKAPAHYSKSDTLFIVYLTT